MHRTDSSRPNGPRAARPGAARSPAVPGRGTRRALAAIPLLLALAPLQAAELVVRVAGIAEPQGAIGCALFRSADGFPLDTAASRSLWTKAETAGVSCRFADVPAGRYAVSVVHDLNGNRRADTNLVGMPTEPWGVSNGVRPTLRAPRFDEAAFVVADAAGDVVVDVKVSK
jgi:uncharacterized protein (DUF2141 family)